MIVTLAVNVSSAITKKDFGTMTGNKIAGWISMSFLIFESVVLEGIYFAQTQCLALALIPFVGELAGPTCVVAAIASMVITAASIAAPTVGVVGISGETGTNTEKKEIRLFQG